VIHQAIALLNAQAIVHAFEGLLPGAFAMARAQNPLGHQQHALAVHPPQG
jgi:hypothetical protein